MPETIQRSFTGGEISPSLRSRADIAKYTSGLAKCENMFIRPQGGAYSRQGLKFIGEIKNSGSKARLIPFSFNTEQTYILVFENNTIRFIRDGGYILENDNTTIYELATTYSSAQLERIQYVQRADVMTIVHPDHPPRNLNRLADNNWTIVDINYDPRIQPPTFPTTRAVSISGVTQANPAVVTTVAGHLFSTGQSIAISQIVGMDELNDRSFTITVLSANTFSLDGEDSTQYEAYSSSGLAVRRDISPFGDGAGDFDKTYSYVITAVGLDGEESVASDKVSVKTKSRSDTAGVRLTWNPVPSASYYRIYKDPSNNTGVFGFIGTSKTTTFEDFNIAPVTSEAPPTLRSPFTDVSGNIENLRVDDLRVTATAHGLVSGETVLIEDLDEPANLNNVEFEVQVIDENTFILLTDIEGPFQTYTSGGTFFRAGQKPATVNYYQQRQVFANTGLNRQTVFTSQVGNFDSLRNSIPTRDSDAITFSIAGREVNEVRHIVEMDSMVLLTSGGTWRITEGQDMVLTPSTVGIRKQSNKGASWTIPVTIDNTVIYVQDKGAKIRDMNYDFTGDQYKGNDLSVMSSHLFEGYQIEEMSHAEEPFGILWCIRNDGKLLGLTYQQEQQVWAWHQHSTDGEFESLATISEANRDATYFIVKRTIGGVTKRYIERMEERVVTASENVFCVDSGLSYSGVPATFMTGLDHLEGENVVALADGNVVKGLTVDNGRVNLPNPATKVVVGLPYTCTMDTLDIDTGELGRTLKAKSVSISKLVIELQDSRGVMCGPIDDLSGVNVTEVKPRFEYHNYNPIPLMTYKAEIILDPMWSRGGGVRLQQTNPLPMGVLSIVPQVDIS